MEPDVRFLASVRGSALLEAARATRDVPAHRRPERLSGLGTPVEVRAALAQDDLRRRAAAKTPDAERLLFLPEALEQASPWPVAVERASRWPAPREAALHDLGAGIGLDALAVARSGRPVVAWERDDARAACLEHNARALGVADLVRIERRDFLEAKPSGALAFLDPDRRPGGRRTREAEAFEPPASSWPEILGRFEAAILKTAPATEILEGRPFEVVSLSGSLRERRIFFGDFRAPLPARRALVLPSVARVEGPGVAWPDPVEVREGDWLLDPDPAVTVAGLVGDLALSRSLRPVHPRIAYLVGAHSDGAPGTWLRVDALLPPRAKEMNAWLHARGVGRLTIRSRGIADDAESWRRRLTPRGERSGTLLFFRDTDDRWRVAGTESDKFPPHL